MRDAYFSFRTHVPDDLPDRAIYIFRSHLDYHADGNVIHLPLLRRAPPPTSSFFFRRCWVVSTRSFHYARDKNAALRNVFDGHLLISRYYT